MNRNFRNISLLLLTALLLGGTLSAQKKILTIGDSTMANYDEEKRSGDQEMRGWGQMLSLYLKGDILLVNAAKNGRSSKSFYHEFWKNLRNTINPGDYVLIQFGHNDEKAQGLDTDPNDETGRGTAAWGQYQEYLKRYVYESRERGATPILLTPIVRRLFDENNQLTGQGMHSLTELAPDDSTMNYPMAMRSLAHDLSVPLIDMTLLTQKKVLKYGAEKAKQVIYANNDNTHLKAMGGILYAGLAVENLLKQNILTDYLTLSSDINIKPSMWNFGSQFLGKSSVKIFSLQGLNVNPQSGIVKLTVTSPFELLTSKTGMPQKELTVSYSGGNLSSPIYVSFSPSETQNYKGDLILTINNKITQKVRLEGEGLGVKGGEIVETDWSLRALNNASIDKNITITPKLVGLKSIDEKNEILLTTPDNKWSSGDIDLNASRYLELAIKASKGTLYLDSLSFEMGAIGGKYMTFTALGSVDKSFSDSKDIVVMDDLPNEKFKEYTFNKVTKVPQGETFYIRIYPWYKMESIDKYINLKNLRVKGLLFKNK